MSDPRLPIWFTVALNQYALNHQLPMPVTSWNEDTRKHLESYPHTVHGAYLEKAEAFRMAIYVRQFYTTTRVECDVLDVLPESIHYYVDERHDDPNNLLRKDVQAKLSSEILEALWVAMRAR